jgi:hypothetical protein
VVKIVTLLFIIIIITGCCEFLSVVMNFVDFLRSNGIGDAIIDILKG